MDDREELNALRRLAELEAKAGGSTMTESPASPEPSTLALAGNAAAKGLASTIDMFGNAPANLMNVGKYIAGDTMEKLGHPIWEGMKVTEPPNLAHRGLTAIGAINPALAPQTSGQRILDTAIQTGVGVAASPAAGMTGVLKNVGMGLASGAAAGITKEATGSDLAALAAGISVPMVAGGLASRANAPILDNPTKKLTLQDAQAVGYVVPPSMAKPSMTTNRLESMSGKAAIKQEAAVRNQTVTNQLAAKAIGLPEDTPLTMDTLNQVRKQAAKPYEEIEALRPTLQMDWFPRYHDTNLLDQLKQARADANTFWRSYNRTADPSVMAQARSADKLAASLEGDMERIAQAAGKPELMTRLKAARQLYARTSDVEQALNLGDGNVSAAVIGRMFDKGHPFTGELKVIGRFAQAFPSVAREASNVPSASVSGTDAAMSAVLGTAGYGAAGGPLGLVAAGAPLLRGPARSFLLSKPYQSRLLRPAPPLSQGPLHGALVGRALLDQQKGE